MLHSNFFEIIKDIFLPITLVLIPLMFKYIIDNEKLKKTNANLKQELKDISLGVQLDLEVFNKIKAISENLCVSTKIDRFLILTASNGMTDMRFVTALYEHHKDCSKVTLSIGAVTKYIKFEFDSAYRTMLKTAEHIGAVTYDVATMADCDLKHIYDNENIMHSKVFFLLRSKIDSENDRIFYCSVATHDDNAFTNKENILIKTEMDKMKLIFKDLETINH